MKSIVKVAIRAFVKGLLSDTSIPGLLSSPQLPEHDNNNV
jgi:hypothetical protein